MKSKKIVRVQEEIPETHYFVYKGQKFPVNFNLLFCISKFFQKNQENQEDKYINLIDKQSEDKFDIPDKIIQDFINYIHREPIEINDENVSILNYLATKYEIESLIKFTQEHINENQKDVIVQILAVNQNDPTINTQSYEDFILKDLLYFIKDDRLLSLNFSILYRILSQYEDNTNDSLIEFYFKCLDKYGQIASLLFSKVDFFKVKNEYMNRIMTEYSKIFDFHFINSSFVRKMHEVENQLIFDVTETKKKCESQEKIIENLKTENEALKKLFNKTNDEMNNQIKLLKEEQSKQIGEIKGRNKSELDLLKKKYEDEIATLKNEIKNLKETPKVIPATNFIEFQPRKGSEFQGICKYLTKKAGRNIHDSGTIEITTNSIEMNNMSHHPKNLVDYGSESYYSSGNDKDIFIRFDFKGNLVQLTDYSLKSWDNSPNGVHIRNWVIECSNDRVHWDEVDRRTDCQTLNNFKITATFNCGQKRNNFYRFVQLRQTGYSWYGYPRNNYYFYFYYIEFFGKLQESSNK